MSTATDTARDPSLRDVGLGSNADATRLSEPGKAEQSAQFDERAEVRFMAEEFGIAPIDAAEMLVTDEARAQALAADVLAEQRESDPLADAPVPDPEQDADHLEKEVDDLEKPVVHDPSAPT